MGYPVKYVALLWVNATFMSLFNRLVLVFMHHTRCARRRFWLIIRWMQKLSPSFSSRLPVTIHALVTDDLAGYSCEKHRTSVHTARYHYHKWFFTDRRDSDFQSLLVSNMRKPESGHTNTQCDKLWRWMPHSTTARSSLGIFNTLR